MSTSSLPAPTAPASTVALFGSSDPLPGEAAYRTALSVGRLLAQSGHTVITGAYAGVMEAGSRGAREAGGRTIGVPCRIFADRSPNRWLDETVASEDLFDRTRELVDRAQGFVVLPGKAGTLAELAWLWALQRAGCLGGRPVVLLGDVWRSLLDLLTRSAILDPEQIRHTDLVDTPEQAVAALDERLRRGGG